MFFISLPTLFSPGVDQWFWNTVNVAEIFWIRWTFLNQGHFCGSWVDKAVSQGFKMGWRQSHLYLLLCWRILSGRFARPWIWIASETFHIHNMGFRMLQDLPDLFPFVGPGGWGAEDWRWGPSGHPTALPYVPCAGPLCFSTANWL